MRGWYTRVPLLDFQKRCFFISFERRVNSYKERESNVCIHCSSIWFCHPSVTRGLQPRPNHGKPRRADLSNNELSIQKHGTRREFIRAKRVGKHLHPHHEPDHRCAGTTSCFVGRRRRSTRREFGSRRASPSYFYPMPVGRSHRFIESFVWRNIQSISIHVSETWHRCHFRRPDRSEEF